MLIAPFTLTFLTLVAFSAPVMTCPAHTRSKGSPQAFRFEELHTVHIGSAPTCLDYLLPQSLRCKGCDNFLASKSGQVVESDPSKWHELSDKRSQSAGHRFRCECPWSTKFAPPPDFSMQLRQRKVKKGVRTKKNKRKRKSQVAPEQSIKRYQDVTAFIEKYRREILDECDELCELEKNGNTEDDNGSNTPLEQDQEQPEQGPRRVSDTPHRMCSGWNRTDKYANLVRMSVAHALLKSKASPNESIDMKISMPTRLPLPDSLKDRRNWDKFSIFCTPVNTDAGEEASHIEFTIRTNNCVGLIDELDHPNATLCRECRQYSQCISQIRRQADREAKDGGVARLTAASIAREPDVQKLVSKIKNKVDSKNKTIRNQKAQNNRLRRNMETVGSRNLIKNKDTKVMLREIVSRAKELLPIVFGENSLQAKVFENAIEMLDDGKKGKKRKRKPQYFDEVITFSLLLLKRCDKGIYDQLAELLHLPTRRTMQQIRSDLYIEDNHEGICKKAINAAWKEIERNGQDDDDAARSLVVSFDSMKIRGCMMYSRAKKDKGKVIGVVLPESFSIAQRQFEKFVDSVTPQNTESEENDKPVDKPPSDNQQDDSAVSQDDKLADDFLKEWQTNTEHTVFYARSLDPACKTTFICARYNTPTIKANDVIRQCEDVCSSLAEAGFLPTILVSDSAGCNQSFQDKYRMIPASHFIPQAVLTKYGLDGNFCIAFEPWWNDGCTTKQYVFIVDDPPHVLKRVGSRMRSGHGINLCWGKAELPMNMLILRDVYEAHCRNEGGLFNLSAVPKLSIDHFDLDKSSTDKMRVRPIAQVLSKTMASLILEVMEDKADKFVLETIGKEANRTDFLSKALELVERLDRWFDICNSIDNTGRVKKEYVYVEPHNAEAIVGELLGMLQWIEEWKQACVDSPDSFLTNEAYKSFQFVCYSFASMIHHFVIDKKQKLLLRRFNQDVNEHHFANVRAAGGHCAQPSQVQTNSSDDLANQIRSMKGTLGQGTNCTEAVWCSPEQSARKRQLEMPISESPRHKRQRST